MEDYRYYLFTTICMSKTHMPTTASLYMTYVATVVLLNVLWGGPAGQGLLADSIMDLSHTALQDYP